MTPTFAAKLGLSTRPIGVGYHKIDGSLLATYGMDVAAFSLQESLRKVRFFNETFMLADIGMKVVLGMLFLAFSNADIRFGAKRLTWMSYTAAEALPKARQVEMIDKYKFAKTALDGNSEIIGVHVTALEVPEPAVHPSRALLLAALQLYKAPNEISLEYADYSDVFLFDLAMELPMNTGINKHSIEFVGSKQPPNGLINSLSQVELETLMTYIETHLKTGFIRLSKCPADASILFDKKLDGSLRLCVDYRGLNNPTIKNQFPLHLICVSLDRLGRAKRFTKLDLTSAHHWMKIWEGDEWETGFLTRYGNFEYQVMPFGRLNALASFQRYINKIFAKKLDIFVIVYLDDVLVFTKDSGQPHMDTVQWVLEQLRKHSFYANLKKCRFHQDEVWFLGFVVSAKGIKIEEERIEAVKAWAEPKSVRDIQVFLGFTNFYRRFIKDFSKITAPFISVVKTTTASPESPPEVTGKVREATGNQVGDRDRAKIGGVKLLRGKNSKNSTKVKNLANSKLQRPRQLEPPLKLGFFWPQRLG